jgi:hypothetical protein
MRSFSGRQTGPRRARKQVLAALVRETCSSPTAGHLRLPRTVSEPQPDTLRSRSSSGVDRLQTGDLDVSPEKVGHSGDGWVVAELALDHRKRLGRGGEAVVALRERPALTL